jgi:hypothetical protein
MTRAHRNRARIAGLLVAAVSLLAMLAMPGAAAAKHGDRNDDRIPDRWEQRHHLSLSVNQARHDQDRDHLRNRAEFLAGDNPRDRDSDDDGVMDGDEDAGTIASFDRETGRLTIALFGSDTIGGLVTDQTRIKCEGEHSPDVTTRARRGEEEPGDDNGEQGEEPGDDNGTGADCTVSDLIPGATVEEAELELENGTATFEEVELAG